MNPEIRQSVRKHSLLLGIFALVVALSVGVVNELTREEIAFQRQEAERRALAEVMPAARHDNDLLEDAIVLDPTESRFKQLDLLGITNTPKTAYIARLNGRMAGVVLPLTVTDGYSGRIDLLVGITADGIVSGVRVLEHRETPGLGDKIDLRVSNWILDFDGKAMGSPPEPQWAVRKDGGAFDQFTGATITPRSVVNGVRKALVFFNDNQAQLRAL